MYFRRNMKLRLEPKRLSETSAAERSEFRIGMDAGEIPIRSRLATIPVRQETGNTNHVGPTECEIYDAVMGTLGLVEAVQPYGGLTRRAAQRLCEAEWPRVYDVIVQLGHPFSARGRLTELQAAVNPVLAGHGVVWDLDDSGSLVRALPVPAVESISAAIQELSDPEYQAALQLFEAAQDAFNDVPRRDPDACANIFDAMESVGQTRFGGNTFGQVLDNLQAGNRLDEYTRNILRKVEILRHNRFGHGTERPFDLSEAEVDFVYLTCVAAIRLLLRL